MEMQDIVDNMFIKHPHVPPILITKAEGVYLHDNYGRKLLDFSGGPMAVNIGHGRKEVAKAAQKQLEEVSYILPVFASEARIELVKRIKKLMPKDLNRIYFCSGGSEANEAAIKFSRQYHVVAGRTSKYKVVSRKLSYHGMTFATLSVGDVKPRMRDFTPMLWNNPKIEACYCYRCPFDKEYPNCDIDCALALEKKILAEGPDTVAAFIAEPIVASASGGTVPPPEYYPIIRETCTKHNVVFIADEVVTGFGRTGRNMGMDHFGVVPDIATFAKGVGSAYAPLAGMAVHSELVELFENNEVEFQHLYTFSAHPLSCAVGNEVQKIIEKEKLIARAEQMGNYLHESLLQLMSLPMVGDVRGKGLLWAIEFVKDKKTKEPFPKEKKVKMDIIMQCMMKGVFFYPGYYEDEQGRGDHIMMAPPFIITEKQIDEAMRVLRETLEESQERYFSA
ncbi:MAG: aspartate aminotransferase family protein [Candidatus Abyssobacteria bacterium SURF_17]|uniref:Aspartate aminotransferase family protein n=1 Tax=Candidatus Abyssobacteria bacterium SURF_17 TaxID=2093361 RepID=A0A419F609_9BACT|nr:MAG: aspartate aminotransferase family protein [Candidatus Abyssubacteria bacterium SURF_17]